MNSIMLWCAILNPTIRFIISFSFFIKNIRCHISMSASVTMFYFLKFCWSEKPDKNVYDQNENK